MRPHRLRVVRWLCLSVWHPPGHAAWEPIITLLSEPRWGLYMNHTAQCGRLSTHPGRISNAIRTRLTSRSQKSASWRPLPPAIRLWFDPEPEPRGAAASPGCSPFGAYDAKAPSEQPAQRFLSCNSRPTRLWAVSNIQPAVPAGTPGAGLVGLCQPRAGPAIERRRLPRLRSWGGGAGRGPETADAPLIPATAGLRRGLTDPGTRVPANW